MASSSVRLLRNVPYSGTRTSIVIGIDVGTTFSGVSYAILRPGKVPEILPVTTFSGQAIKSSKIPSIIYYDMNDGYAIKAIGPSVTSDKVKEDAFENKNWFKAEHFKLHLRPPGMRLETNGRAFGKLPSGRKNFQVMGDFLRYLLEETAKYIIQSHADGKEIWAEVQANAVYILGHPNSWAGFSQGIYRASAVFGGLVQNIDESLERVKFVTEGEASALSCLSSGLGPLELDAGFRFVIVDAGGGTIDVSMFEVSSASPLELKECSVAESRFAGSVFVDDYGTELLQGKLKGSTYEDDVESLVSSEFELKIKRVFDGEQEYGIVKVAGLRTNDETRGIKNGKLRLSRDEIAACFAVSIRETADSVRKQLKTKQTPVWLVGGFGSSPYLLKGLKNALESSGVNVQTPGNNLAKAVANGAVLHFIDGLVTSRVCKTTYGTSCMTLFNPFRPDHRERMDDILPDSDGRLRIGPVFDCIVEKGTQVKEGQTFSETYITTLFNKAHAERFTTVILCYDGEQPMPYWYEENEDKFRKVCTLEADLSSMCSEVPEAPSLLAALLTGFKFPKAAFDIELKFGTTDEIQARVRWQDKGETKYGPVKICWEK